jgi:PiT family inorganic phosphate transporter
VHFDTPITTGGLLLLGLALLVACGFEFVNGFHDTANAVATVIYTHSLRPSLAVIWSGICNFLGVSLGGIAVAMSIIKLLPVELLASSGSGAGLAMVLALLVAAIVWNLGTWYFGLPASSSHTLVGAIVGVGLANSLMPGHVFGSGVNWVKVKEIGLSLVISPLVGLAVAAGLLLLARRVLQSRALHTPPDGKTTPPTWIRGLLIATCSGVSFAHGSNDGQKGVGLIMLILIGLLPADYALNGSFHRSELDNAVAVTRHLDTMTRTSFGGDERMASNVDMAAYDSPTARVLSDLADIRSGFNGKEDVRSIPPDERFALRSKIIRVDSALGDLEKKHKLSPEASASLKKERTALRASVDYAPRWVLVLVALALGVGTMIGWKRIVVTVGEKIGKAHLTYAQGASAELVAMSTIGLSGWLGLPVSTTHVLSSGIAGTMVAQKAGLQKSTVRNIALAWILTLPASIVLAGVLFLLFRAIIPDANAATPTVRFTDPQAEQAIISKPALGKPLRLHGSNTIGSELAPALAKAFLQSRGATDVKVENGVGGHAFVVSAALPNEPQRISIEIDAEGSSTAFTDLAKGTCDIGMASRPVRPGESTVALDENVIGLDGVAVIVYPRNGTHALEMRRLADIFDGSMTSWPDTHAPIALYARDEQSGTFDAFKSIVLGDRPLAASAKRFSDSTALAAAVASDENAIGFVAMPYVRGTGALAISDGGPAIAPSAFSVATEAYPLTRRLYLYLPEKPEHPLARDLVAFALGAEGQKAVANAGFIGATTDAAADQCASCTPEYLSLTKNATRLPVDFRFRSGSQDLDSRGRADVRRLAASLSTHSEPHVMLFGFSDSAGTADLNLSLSKARAKQVADDLEPRGVHAVEVRGFGSDMPIASNDTLTGRDRNRRVEVWLVP